MARRLKDGRAVHRADGLRFHVVAEATAGARGEGAATAAAAVIAVVQPVHLSRRARHEKHPQKYPAPVEDE